MGIDRVVMFLTDSTSEFDCLALPALRSEILNTHPPPLFYLRHQGGSLVPRDEASRDSPYCCEQHNHYCAWSFGSGLDFGRLEMPFVPLFLLS